ncbi:MAG: FIST N-terminal domain-containing protein [Acidocella sp.]|nr:FIST N-terminal domain-containing protein [Acidocella sp.]
MNGSIRSAYACDVNALAAVKSCAAQIDMAAPDLLVAFVGGKHIPAAALAAIQSLFGDTPLAGGAAAGVIAASGFGYTGFEIGLIAFKGAAVTPLVLTNHNLLAGETQAGHELGARVRACTDDGAVVFLLFDSVASSPPLRMHPASQIVEGFNAGLNGRTLHLVGGGLLVDINLSDAWIFAAGEVRKHAVTALVFPAGLRADTVIFHGCRPVSSFLDITRIEGAEVLELNNEPALTVVERMLGLELGTTSGQQLSLVATLGQKQGNPFAPYNENNYVNRLILQADPLRGSLTLFEPDFAVGDRVQIMSRDNTLMLESVERGVSDLVRRIEGADCLLGLYVDCAGRASVMTGAETEEADLLCRNFKPSFPFMGFYSGVEIAPFGGHYSRPLDWTGVLTVLHSHT